MGECIKCGQDMEDAQGCDSDRTIEFNESGIMSPIPFGEEIESMSYQERLDDYELQINSGGRGDLGPKQIHKELKRFKEKWDEENYNTRNCHSCGAMIGEYHHPGCDVEQCPQCDGQYLTCDCATDEKEQLWG